MPRLLLLFTLTLVAAAQQPARPTTTTAVTVTADLNDLDLLSPDPGEKVFVRRELLDANPGRPGAPVSLPGYPIETASSGIKAPQYFAPGVAGDHGEPIAQYLAVGSFLLPNNLSANAHGNGYADPNLLIPQMIESAEVSAGAFNVREGNHAVNLAVVYGLRARLDPFLTLTGDLHDLDLTTGLAPSPHLALALEASVGNGFLTRAEHRQQYKLNTLYTATPGPHRLTLLAIAYFGRSRIPGLVPLPGAYFLPTPLFPNTGDTIDPRQRDQTHTALLALNDTWRLSPDTQLLLSAFFRTYKLSLSSDFGQGLIRQSEFRTVAGASANYTHRLAESLSLLTGLDYNREAPRRDNLDQYGLPSATAPATLGPFTKVDSNNITLTSYTPYAAVAGSLSPLLRYNLGWRRDQIQVDNRDLLAPANSFNRWSGLNGPKATVSFIPKDSWHAPLVSLSFGQAFFTDDPRIGIGIGTGTGTAAGTSVATAHSHQLVASETLGHTDLKLTLGHVTTSAELAKLDPDTGLQQDQGPAVNRFLTLALRHTFPRGSFLATFSKADARDLDSGQPTPEAPRTLFDLLASLHTLPFHLQARAEFEYVGAKPLGTGCAPNPDAQCTSVSVKELRTALLRPLLHNRIDLGLNTLLARGYTGQTLESLQPSDFSQPVGVRLPSYVALNLTYHFTPTHP